MKRLIPLLLLALASFPARADDAATVDRWYEALAAADAQSLEALLAPEAIIILNDIGITQTKTEFVASMDEWKSAVAGGSIRHKPDGAADGMAAYKVCYDFPRNDLLTRELFAFDNGRIVRSEQGSLAESCDGF